MRYILIVAVCLLLMSGPVFSAKNFSNVTIKDVIVNMSSGVYFRINENMANSEGCTTNAWFKVESQSTYEKEALALLLAFQAQDKPVTVYITGCTAGYPKLGYIY